MSDANPSKVFLFDNDDAMQAAREAARATFGYFWRELAWERRRIVPALDVACVKMPFSDGDGPRKDGNPSVEEMWVQDVDFDGDCVAGELLNEPNWVLSAKQGDAVVRPLGQISDWMYVITGEAYGGHTVQVLRSRMSSAERKQHDAAWGLNFGDPAVVRLAPSEQPKQGVLGKLFGKGTGVATPPPIEHPMSVNMAPVLREKVAEDPSFLTSADERGWTILHDLALAGSTDGVRVLIEAGADANLKTRDGRTPIDLARSLGWDATVAALRAR